MEYQFLVIHEFCSPLELCIVDELSQKPLFLVHSSLVNTFHEGIALHEGVELVVVFDLDLRNEID